MTRDFPFFHTAPSFQIFRHRWKQCIAGKFSLWGKRLKFNPPAGPEPSPSPAPRGPSPAAVLAGFSNLANSSYYLSMDLQMGFSSGQTHQSLSLQDRQIAGQRDSCRAHSPWHLRVPHHQMGWTKGCVKGRVTLKTLITKRDSPRHSPSYPK